MIAIQPDFREQKPALVEVIEARGHLVAMLPKFHCKSCTYTNTGTNTNTTNTTSTNTTKTTSTSITNTTIINTTNTNTANR